MKVEINLIHQDMEECRERIQTIEDTHIPKNIRQTQIKLINVWKQEDELYYDSTNVYKATKDLIVSCTIVTLVGGPGCGKTATARHIALQYEKRGWEIVPVFRPEEIVLYGDFKQKQIFVLDDMLGVFAVDLSLYNNINNHKEGILNAISNESKLLFTCRKSVYNEAINLKSFVIRNIIDLQSEENVFNECEQENILAKHCRYKGVPENVFCNLRISSSFIMFPLLCKIFSASHTNHVSVDRFFANPFDCVIDELNELEYRTAQHYAALVLCVLSNNILSTENLIVDDKQEIKLDAYNTCGINIGTSDKEIKNALSNLVGTYLSQNEDTFTFIHDAIYELTAYHYGKTNPQIILKYMKSNFISTKVTVIKNQINDVNTDLSILIEEKYYEQLAKRLYTDLQSFEVFDVFTNKSLKYHPFLKIFIKILRETSFKEVKTLICHEQISPEKDICSRYKRKTDNFLDESKEQGRQGLLYNVRNYKTVPHNIRIISWIIYYDHTNLLTSIVSLVKENNYSTDIVFGSDITEQARLLILGCYSGNPDMVKLILKYVKIGCINRTSIAFMDNDDYFIYLNRAFTPLTSACDSGNLSIVQTLLRNNANTDQCDGFFRFPLLCASEQGHYDVVEYLLEKGGNVNQCNEHKETALQEASYSGHHTVVKFLVQKGADVNQCNRNNQSPLYKACTAGHPAVVEYLIENGADVDQCSDTHESPLYEASRGGHFHVVELLIQKGADVNQCDRNNQSPLSKASEGGHSAIVEYLIEKGAKVNQCTDTHESPLYKASSRGHFHVVELLIQKGAIVNNCNTNAESPLHRASETGCFNVVECLVQQGANVNQQNADEETSLFKASRKGHLNVVAYLVQNGADFNKCNKDKKSPLCSAAQSFIEYANQSSDNRKSLLKTIQYLVNEGADVNQCYDSSKSPLYWASYGGYLEAVEFLVESGAEVNKCSEDNESPLYKASAEGHIDVVNILVQNGADVNQCDKYNQSPLYKAIKLFDCRVRRNENMLDTVEYLIQKGANVNQCTKGNISLLFEASSSGYFEIVKLLVQKGASVNQCNTNAESSLYKASKEGHFNVVEYLVQQGANVNQQNADEETSLFIASREGHYQVLEYLFQNGADVHQCNKDNVSPLCSAVRSFNSTLKVVQYLVSKDANVNQCCKSNTSPLYWASYRGRIENVELLLKNEAEVNKCCKDNKSPLYRASEGGHFKVVEYFVQKGAVVNQQDTDKKTPLYNAVENRHFYMVKFLIENEADLTVRTHDGISPLQLAIWSNCSEISTELMRMENHMIPFSANHHLLDILIDLRKTEAYVSNEVVNDGVGTKEHHPLLKYVLYCTVEQLKHLFKLGFNVNQYNNKGQQLLSILIECSHISLRYLNMLKVKLCLQKGADLTIRDDHCLSLLEKTRQFIKQWKGQKYEIEDKKVIIQSLKRHMRRNSL